jgi:hypothetical protein
VLSRLDLERVTLVVKAMRLGLDPRRACPKDPRRVAGTGRRRGGRARGQRRRLLAAMIDAVETLDPERLDATPRKKSEVLGGGRFASECLGPFVERIGDLWMKGRLDVHHGTLRQRSGAKRGPGAARSAPRGARSDDSVERPFRASGTRSDC